MPLISPTAASTRAEIDKRIQALFIQMQNTLNACNRFVWNNPKYTPQEILNEYNTNAVALFQLSELLRNTINSAIVIMDSDTPQVPAIDMTGITINQNGTVTVSNP